MSGNLSFSVTPLKYGVFASLSYQHGAMFSQMFYELTSFHFSLYAKSWLTPRQESGAGTRGWTDILPTHRVLRKGLLGHPDAVPFHLDLLVTIEITSAILLHI